jgi:hypothetical protein
VWGTDVELYWPMDDERSGQRQGGSDRSL